jgi:hypothetical protein
MPSGPASQCTPSHCTWGEVGGMYSSASFLAGLAVIILAVLLIRAAARR